MTEYNDVSGDGRLLRAVVCRRVSLFLHLLRQDLLNLFVGEDDLVDRVSTVLERNVVVVDIGW